MIPVLWLRRVPGHTEGDDNQRPHVPSRFSQQLPPKWGVRRVNNLPLYLIGTAAAVFFLIIMLVAMDRANTKHAQESVKASGNAALYANEIAGEHQGGMIAPAPQLALEEGIYPVSSIYRPYHSNRKHVAISEMAEAQRIRQMKMQQFEEALQSQDNRANPRCRPARNSRLKRPTQLLPAPIPPSPTSTGWRSFANPH